MPETMPHDPCWDTPLPDGTAVITVTAEDGGKTATCTVTVTAPTAVETWHAASLQVYPNPTDGELRIKNEELREGLVAVIYDAAGKPVMSFELPNSPETVIDISHLQSGMYLIKIDDGKQKRITKVIKN